MVDARLVIGVLASYTTRLESSGTEWVEQLLSGLVNTRFGR